MNAIQKLSLLPALQDFGRTLGELSNEDMPAAYELVTKIEHLVEDAREMLRQRALLYLTANGEKVTDKGTTEAKLSGYIVRAIPMRTGTDPKKLEQTLRMKKLNPEHWMQMTVTFKTDEKKLKMLIDRGDITAQDMEACAYDKTYRLEVKKGMNDE